ncbi:Mut7-C RNAse domain-containing protein [Ramlibacter sp.]|uniref:Mut7-C RNAse domain-containing protein n=1 Tax=Ramlibacter sp. TaxID=1917967 RepID=UPI002D2A9A80|nr:Mut7-C RNAse domain-containing protein [Ramlibacter sp.]HYD77332.1 Mut7-C RNAse domain-containing protein [Ramlibacter sp.]
MAPAEPRFAADAMLARLARWLRVIGWDTTLDPALPDPELVRLADEQARLLLTRDRHLLRELRPRRALRIEHDDPLLQLSQVVSVLDLNAPPELFTRCTVCNTPLSPPLPEALRIALLPPDVRTLPGAARQCPGCGRLYWLGSHARRMREAIERTLPGWLGSGTR